MSVTALQIITAALDDLGVYAVGEALTADQAADGLRRLNQLVASWHTQSLTWPFVARETFSLVANQGGPSNPYTIGSGGTFNTTRPPTITGAGLLLGSSSPVVEIPLAVITDDAWQAVQIKALTSAQPTLLYYNPTYASDLGTINLWPVPNTAANSLALYRGQQIAAFATLSTSYDLPPGCADALEYQLALRLGPPNARVVADEIRALAISTLRDFKRANLKLCDLMNDTSVLNKGAWRYGYNINTNH